MNTIEQFLEPLRSLSGQQLTQVQFFGGMCLSVLTPMLAFAAPGSFSVAWLLVCVPLMVYRFISYTEQKYAYFMLDFCYLSNVICGLSVLTGGMQQLNFALANGPLLFAAVVWSNAIWPASVDKMTSTYLHVAPALLCYVQRWVLQPQAGGAAPDATIAASSWLLLPMILYTLWQGAYLYLTEVTFAAHLKADWDQLNSFRWVVRRGGGIAALVVPLARKAGVLKSDESMQEGDPRSLGIFVASQAAYTFVTLLPVPWMYSSQWLHTLVLLGCTLSTMWTGAGYFSKAFQRRSDKRGEQSSRTTQVPAPVYAGSSGGAGAMPVEPARDASEGTPQP